MALDDPPLLLAAAPTLEIDGMSYPLVARNLERMRVTEGQGGLSSLELALADTATQKSGQAAHAANAASPLKLGAGIRVFAGPAEVQAAEVFDGQVTAIEAEVREAGAQLFTVLAEDRLFAMRRRRRTRLFEDMKLGDVAEAIASDHGLKAEVRDGVESPGRNWMQADETDLAFLRRILGRFDADVQVVGDRMQVGRAALDQRSLVKLHAGANLKVARITADVAEQVTEVRLASFDPKSGETVDASADCRGSGPGTGKTGGEVLNDKFAAVKMHLGRFGPMAQAEADALARSECDRRARAFVRVTGTAKGIPQLRVGSWVALSGVNPQFENEYAVTRAVHRWARSGGYFTDFEAECAYLGDPQ